MAAVVFQHNNALVLSRMLSLGCNRCAEPLQPEDIHLLDSKLIFGRYSFGLPSSVQNHKTSTGKGNI